MDESLKWLRWLYGPEPLGSIWIGGHGDHFAGRTFTNIDDAAGYGRELDAGGAGGVYHRLTTLRDIERGRGTAADSAYLPALAMDLDIRGPGHKALNYPGSEEDLVTLLRKSGLPEPSAWVHSGGGRYPFWKLERPFDLSSPAALEQAARISNGLHKLVIACAADAGWKVDNTGDLARVFRLPGTLNRKTGEPALAYVQRERSTGLTYSLEEIGQAVHDSALPTEFVSVSPERSPFITAGQGSALFSAGAPRYYTVAEAMHYVAPALQELRTAPDGEINIRLNTAALTMAHFGEEFWSRDAARAQLLTALRDTVYDGATWQAEDTIASAYAAMDTKVGVDYWKAVLRPETVQEVSAPADEVDALIAEMLTTEQVAELPSPRPLIKGLLDMDSEAWMIGAPGSKKSFVALDMAGHVGRGMSWQGLRTHQGEVVMIVAEGASGVSKRVRAWAEQYGPMTGVRILPRPVQAKNLTAWAVLVHACTRIKPALVIIDTQARVTVGLKENAAEEMGVYTEAVRAIREATGACVLTVHHTGRDGKDARGSSALDGAQGTELKVESTGALRGFLATDKQKDMEQKDRMPLYFAKHDLELDEDGEPITSLTLLPADAWRQAEQLVEVIESGQEVHTPEPEGWTWALVSHNSSFNTRRVLQVLHSLAGETGMTQPQVERVIRSRWYDGRPLKKETGHLSPETWAKSWSAARELVSASGEPVLTNPGGERWAVNPDALSELS